MSDSGKVNILLVDDNESNLLALETILQAEDRNLIRAASGDEALHYLLRNDVAVILLDVRMPGISGLETAELIRGRNRSRDVPIIFLTAYDSADRVELSKGYSLGAVDYIIKPLDSEALRSKVNVFVELYKKTEQVRQQAGLLHEKNIQLENANFERLGKLVELGQRLTREREPDRLLQVVCAAASDIIGSHQASVRCLDAGGVIHELALSSRRTSSVDQSKWSQVDEFLMSAPANAAGAADGILATDGTGESIRMSLSRGFLLASPIPLPGRGSCWLCLLDRLDFEEFSEADERLAMTLAGQVAVAYQNARLHDDARQHATALESEVTDRKQAQEEKERLLIREQSARLEAERAELLSSQLLMREKEARAEAEAANRLKDEFLATVSHELRTPLNSILGWAQLLRTGSLDDGSGERALQTIERNSKALAQIIDDLLDVSRIITGKLRLDVKPIEIVPILEASLEAIRPAIDAKNISLTVSLDPMAGAILGDSNRLQQIVWNLLSNAIKFTPNHGSVGVRLERIGADSRITVSDTGEGISEAFLPYVFDRFRQADSTFARTHGGLGLGLAIVRHLVEMHGGKVGAHSDGPGRGASFMVSFPLLNAQPAEHLIRPERNRSTQHDSVELAGLSVLIVDDESDAREVLVAVLERCGADVIVASSAVEALDHLRESAGRIPDVLVSDIGMPGEDGINFIRKVRSLAPDRGGAIPAIAVTAYARPEDQQRVLEAGFQYHMPKPVEPSTLASVIASLARRAATA